MLADNDGGVFPGGVMVPSVPVGEGLRDVVLDGWMCLDVVLLVGVLHTSLSFSWPLYVLQISIKKQQE